MDSIQTSLLLKMWVIFDHYSTKWFSPNDQAHLLYGKFSSLRSELKKDSLKLREKHNFNKLQANSWKDWSGYILQILSKQLRIKPKGRSAGEQQNVPGFEALLRSGISARIVHTVLDSEFKEQNCLCHWPVHYGSDLREIYIKFLVTYPWESITQFLSIREYFEICARKVLYSFPKTSSIDDYNTVYYCSPDKRLWHENGHLPI